MTELSINTTIKWILGVVVFVVVVIGIGLIFKNKIIAFFQNLPGSAPAIFLNLVR